MSAITERHESDVTLPPRAELADRVPAAAARRILQMDPADRPAALDAMPGSEGLAAFLEMRPEGQASVLEHMELGRAAKLANRLPFNTLARVLQHLEPAWRDAIVRNLRPLKRSRVETVLSARLQ